MNSHLHGRLTVCLPWVIGLMSTGGCGPAHHIARIQDVSLEDRRIPSVQALAKYPKDQRATQALLEGLRDENAAVRYFAVDSLECHLSCGADEYTRCIQAALIDMLDDDAIAGYTRFVPGLPVGYTTCSGSVRARALLVLTTAVGKDFGFDKNAWLTFLDKVKGVN